MRSIVRVVPRQAQRELRRERPGAGWRWCSFLRGAAVAVARATAGAARHERRDASFSRTIGRSSVCFELRSSQQGF